MGAVRSLRRPPQRTGGEETQTRRAAADDKHGQHVPRLEGHSQRYAASAQIHANTLSTRAT